MHSRSAACVFGEARLISSTSSRFANTGPGLNSNSFVLWLKTFTPVTSDGSRSGVNCSRENEQSSERARAFASIVFPTPGKSSMIRWPSLIRQSTLRRSVSSGAWTTRARLSTIARAISAASAARSSLAASSKELLRLVQDRGCDLALRSLRHPALAAVPDQDDLVVGRVETDVVAGDVVEDDQVCALGGQLLARPGETRLTLVR